MPESVSRRSSVVAMDESYARNVARLCPATRRSGDERLGIEPRDELRRLSGRWHRQSPPDKRGPEEHGRFNVRVESGQEGWAEVAMLLAGDGYGTWFRPDPDDEVLVAFEAG